MGSGSSAYSQEDYNRFSLELYQATLQQPCLLPDVGIDESLLKYSGTNSNTMLQVYSNELINDVPGYVEKLGSGFSSINSFPNAVGLGALVISIIMELIIKSSTQKNDDTYGLLQRVFGEEKASSVRDTMSEYVKRHRMYMNDAHRLQMELMRVEVQLSNQLTILRNSMLHDEQISTRGFKIWVNGVSFHIQMLIHTARLNTQTGISASDFVQVIKSSIDSYLLDLEHLLKEYKALKTRTTGATHDVHACSFFLHQCAPARCAIEDDDKKDYCELVYHDMEDICTYPDFIKAYIDHVFSRYEPISGLKSHFLNIKSNLNSLINQQGSFTLPSAG